MVAKVANGTQRAASAEISKLIGSPIRSAQLSSALQMQPQHEGPLSRATALKRGGIPGSVHWPLTFHHFCCYGSAFEGHAFGYPIVTGRQNTAAFSELRPRSS